MQEIIEKFQIDVTPSGLQKFSNEDQLRLKCLQDDQVYYGYKKNEFFDDPNVKDSKQILKAQKTIDKIIAHVNMKEELNLLADLIYKRLTPQQMQGLIGKMTFLPIDW